MVLWGAKSERAKSSSPFANLRAIVRSPAMEVSMRLLIVLAGLVWLPAPRRFVLPPLQ
jgi:hypothetical protein